jgi:hypothetical protein
MSENINLVTGKWYVIDLWKGPYSSGPVAGPFETEAEAEKERKELNIAEDCTVRQFIGQNRTALNYNRRVL